MVDLVYCLTRLLSFDITLIPRLSIIYCLSSGNIYLSLATSLSFSFVIVSELLCCVFYETFEILPSFYCQFYCNFIASAVFWIALFGAVADCLAKFLTVFTTQIFTYIFTNVFTYIFSKRQEFIVFHKNLVCRLNWYLVIFYILHPN